MYLTLIIIILLVAYCLIFRWKKRRFYELASKIPGRDGLPFLGSGFEFFGLEYKDYFEKTLELTESEDGKISKVWFGPKCIVTIESPETVQAAFKSPHCSNKPDYFYKILYQKFGLLSINGTLFEKHRKILHKSFMPSMLQPLIPVFNAKSKVCMEKLKENLDGSEFDVSSFVGACTLESFNTAHLDNDVNFYNSTTLHVIEKMKPLMSDRLFNPLLHIDFIFNFTTLSKKLNVLLEQFYEVASNCINKNRSSDKNFDSTPTVINQLLNPKHELTEEEIKDEVILFQLAGFETSALSLSATILMVALHKNVQQKIQQEIDELINGKDLFIDEAIIEKLPYLEMVIKESMRLFPIAGFIGREVSEEVELEGYLIPKETVLLISIFKMQRNPKYFGSDAHLFRPERFAPENAKNINLNAFIPFSGGRRICLGYKYAWLFMKIYLAHFFKTYEVSSSLKYDELETQISPTLSIIQNYMISIKRR